MLALPDCPFTPMRGFAPTFAGWMFDVSGSYAVPVAVGVAANALAAAIASRLPAKGGAS